MATGEGLKDADHSRDLILIIVESSCDGEIRARLALSMITSRMTLLKKLGGGFIAAVEHNRPAGKYFTASDAGMRSRL